MEPILVGLAIGAIGAAAYGRGRRAIMLTARAAGVLGARAAHAVDRLRQLRERHLEKLEAHTK